MDAIEKFDLDIDMNQVNEDLDKIKKAASKNQSVEQYCDIFNMIDLTTLKETDNEPVIEAMCVRVNGFKEHFSNIPPVAAICVYPSMVKYVKQHLRDKDISIASVAGGFPASQTFLEVKEQECKLAVAAGANEIDMVIPVGSFIAGSEEIVFEETKRLKQVIGDKHLKVILETGDLTPKQIQKASFLAMTAGADFIKTSTGKANVSATHEAMYIMCKCIKDFYNETGKKVGIKPAGGISESDDSLIYYRIVEQVLGKEWLNNKLFRFGASRLANSLINTINELRNEKTGIKYF